MANTFLVPPVGDINIVHVMTVHTDVQELLYMLCAQRQPANILCEVNKALKNTNGSL